MNNEIINADFTTTFPPALKNDKKLAALAKEISEELSITANSIKKNIIYARIDELSEYWLDILAYDLHVDWYDYDYPIDAKRAILKDSVKVHQKLGTKRAVEMALGGIHPNSEIEEWFNYNGLPFGFRIVLDTTNSRVEAEYDKIVKTVDMYKRLTAHLDGLYYQCSVLVGIVSKTEYFRFRTGMTGAYNTGENPNRNTVGAVGNGKVVVEPTAVGYKHIAPRTGTKPNRNIVFTVNDNKIVTDSDTENYKYSSNQTGKTETGTTPYIDTIGGTEEQEIAQTAAVEVYQYSVKRCGTTLCK